MENRIWHNGTFEDSGGRLPDDLRLTNAVWQAIAVEHGRALFVAQHIRMTVEACRFLYAFEPQLSEVQLGVYIERLLIHNRMPARGGALVFLVTAPNLDGGADVALLCAGRLLYPGLVQWHQRLKATRVACDGGFASGYSCTSSLVDAGYCLQRARLGGFEAAVRCAHGAMVGLDWQVWSADADGLDTRSGVGEWPLFGVRGREVFTPSLDSGVADSVWRRLGVRALEQAGVGLHEVALMHDDLETLDELFAITPQGVVGVLHCDGRLLYNMMAEKVVRYLAMQG